VPQKNRRVHKRDVLETAMLVYSGMFAGVLDVVCVVAVVVVGIHC
jgi:hypothetical protein